MGIQIVISYEPVRPPLWRVLHEAEVPEFRRNVPPRMPEVRPFFPNHHSEFGKHWQGLSWDMNPLLNAGNMTAVYDGELWVANNQGFGMDGDPRANYFTNRNLTFENIRVEALTCGGNVLTGYEEDTNLVVETLQWSDPVPTVGWIEKRPWLITHAVKLDGDGLPARFGQGYSHLGFTPGVRHPLVANPKRYKITIPKWRVVRWTESELPDPYKVYLTI